MKFVLIVILLLVLGEGCISPVIKTGDPSQYELQGLANTTIFYLNLSSIQVIDNVINETSVDYLIEYNVENFRQPVAMDYSGNNASVNVSIITIRGKNYAHFNFSSNFSGFVAYTMPGSQDFTYLPVGNGTIRVVLPENFTAGTMFLGYIDPNPNNITQDSKGREVLTWDNPGKKIRVRYHHEDTPVLLMYLFGFLLACAVIVWIYYHYSILALSKKRKMLENIIKK
jgi:hypothetical protein